MARGRRTTGLFQSLFNAITHSGTTIKRTTDFWGHQKTVVHNYDTGTTKEYIHNKGFLGDRTDVKVYQNGSRVGKGNIKHSFWGRDIETLKYNHGPVRKTVKQMRTVVTIVMQKRGSNVKVLLVEPSFVRSLM